MFLDCKSSTLTIAYYKSNTVMDKKKKLCETDSINIISKLYTTIQSINHIHSTNMFYKLLFVQ